MGCSQKITATNTWNFALIDYFADLTLLRNDEDQSQLRRVTHWQGIAAETLGRYQLSKSIVHFGRVCEDLDVKSRQRRH